MIEEQQKEERILDSFMGMMLKKGQRVNVFLHSGVRLQGFIINFDEECIGLHDRPQGEPSTMILRNNISSIAKDTPVRQ